MVNDSIFIVGVGYTFFFSETVILTFFHAYLCKKQNAISFFFLPKVKIENDVAMTLLGIIFFDQLMI